MDPTVDTTNPSVHSQILMPTEPKNREIPLDSARSAAEKPVSRKPYEAPRVERRIPIAANTLQPTSGTENVFPEEP
jgi:hypothetical protein